MIFAVVFPYVATESVAGEDRYFALECDSLIREGQPLGVYVYSLPRDILARGEEIARLGEDVRRRIYHMGTRMILETTDAEKAIEKMAYELRHRKITERRAVPADCRIDVELTPDDRRFFSLPRLVKARKIESEYVGVRYSYTRLVMNTLGLPPGGYGVTVTIRDGQADHRARTARTHFSAPLQILRVENDEDRALLLLDTAKIIAGDDKEEALKYLRLVPQAFPDIAFSFKARALEQAGAIYFEGGDRIGAIAAGMAVVSQEEGHSRFDLLCYVRLAQEVSLERILEAIPRASQLSREFFGKDAIKPERVEAFFRALYKAVAEEDIEKRGAFLKALTPF